MHSPCRCLEIAYYSRCRVMERVVFTVAFTGPTDLLESCFDAETSITAV
jgi:uncharacterized membrane protein YcjF (UPF0283 family)